MPHYRATIRYGAPQTYHVLDVEAADLPAALERVARSFPEGSAATADLVEVRRQVAPQSRGYPAEE